MQHLYRFLGQECGLTGPQVQKVVANFMGDTNGMFKNMNLEAADTFLVNMEMMPTADEPEIKDEDA